jgi:hypothetical protein
LVGFAVFFVTFAAVLLPWVIRNYRAFHAFIPGSTHSGDSLYQSNFALGEAGYLLYRTTEKSEAALLNVLERRFGPVSGITQLQSYARAKGLNEYQVDRVAFQEAVSIIRSYPGRYFVASIVRFTRLWFGSRFVALLQGRGSLWSYPVPILNGVLLALAVTAAVCYRGDWVIAAIPLFVLILYTTVLYAATLGIARFSVPVMPYVMVFAAYATVCLFGKRLKRHTA